MSVHPALPRYLNAITDMAASVDPLPVRLRAAGIQIIPLRADELPEEVREDHDAILAGLDGGHLGDEEALGLIQRANAVLVALAYHRPSVAKHLGDAGVVKRR